MLRRMGGAGMMWDVPPMGRPVMLRGREVAVVLEAFAPTHLDAWTGRAAFPLAAANGVPSAVPVPVDGDAAVLARAIVVRHGGNVAGRSPWFGPRRRRLDVLFDADLPDEPVVGIVIEPAGPSLVWVRGEPDRLAEDLSREDWRSFVG